MNKFDNEKDFENYFYSLTDPQLQIKELAEWRNFQIRIVSKFIEQIKLVANEQYTSLDHFLLELLQNADDNEYDNNASPTVTLKLSNDTFTLLNNEKGFSPENLYAITYSAASTKPRQKTAATFIGEKGIGFKSVFAVAEYVDLHSGPYDFRLKNKEFIIPHLLPAKEVKGTEISLKLKKDIEDLPIKHSRLLRKLCQSAQEVTLFLQRIELLTIDDQVSNNTGEVRTERDQSKKIYRVQTASDQRMYASFDYKITIPNEIVSTRFQEIKEDLEREIVFAVPFPSEGGVQRNGKLFCYLPTLISTGTPIHVQLDAKTVANREDIIDFTSNPWNKNIFTTFSDEMAKMYENLTDIKQFKSFLPEYWPYDADNFYIMNKDVKALILEVKAKMQDKSIILDRHGNFNPSRFVRSVGHDFIKLFYEDKYEQALSRYLVGKGGGHNYNVVNLKEEKYFTLIDEGWAQKYSSHLKAMGVNEIDLGEGIVMLEQGPPKWVNINDASSVIEFLRLIMEYEEKVLRKATDYVYGQILKASHRLKNLPIFPLKKGKSKSFGALDEGLRWVSSDTPNISGNFDLPIIDPRYTYSPGGGGKEEGQQIREFHGRFRDFLRDIGVEVFTRSELLSRTVIQALKTTKSDPNNHKDRRKLNDQWFSLYMLVWRRETTIKREEGGEEHWQKLLAEISQCKIPARVAGEQPWKLVPVKEAFVGPEFTPPDLNLEKIYIETGAFIIRLDYLQSIAKTRKAKRERKVNWNDWYKFLLSCKAKSGPYFVYVPLDSQKNPYKQFRKFNVSSSAAYLEQNNVLAANIRSAIATNSEYQADKAESFWLENGARTVSIDPVSEKLLGKESMDFLARKLSEKWNETKGYFTEINFCWGSRYKPRQVKTPIILVHEQVRRGLMLHSDKGFRLSTNCYEDNAYNKLILGNLVAFVNPQGRGYNRDLLEACGLKLTVSSSDILSLIITWFDSNTSKSRTAAGFLPYLKAYKNLASSQEVEISELRAKVPLYCPSQDALLTYDKWLSCVEPDEFPSDIIDALALAMGDAGESDPVAVLDILFSLGDISRNKEVLFRGLVDIGKLTRGKNSAELKQAFDERLKAMGIRLGNEVIKKSSQLPLLWDIIPYPAETSNILPVQPAMNERQDFINAAKFIGWPLLSINPKKVECHGCGRSIDGITARRIFLSFDDIGKKLAAIQPRLKKLLDQLEIFGSPEIVMNSLQCAEDLKLIVDNINGKTISISVPYWYDEGKKFYFSGETSLNKALPEFFDWKLGSTITPFFDYIWKDMEELSRVYTGRDIEDEIISIPSGSQANPDGDSLFEGGPKGKTEVNIYDENEKENNGPSSEANQPSPSVTNETIRQRSRLYSYVPRKGQKTANFENTKQEADRKRLIDHKGAERLKKYFKSLQQPLSLAEQVTQDVSRDF